MSAPSSTSRRRTFWPSGPVWWVLSCMPRISPARRLTVYSLASSSCWALLTALLSAIGAATGLTEVSGAEAEQNAETIGLQQNHGGWNSDDHQNNNLGRFRVSATNAPEAQADPLPKRVRDLLAIPRETRMAADYFIRQSRDADGLAAELDTPEKRRGYVAQMYGPRFWAAPGGFTGERFLEKCAPTLAEPTALVEGLHVFTFNQVAETEAWRQDLLSREYEVKPG